MSNDPTRDKAVALQHEGTVVLPDEGLFRFGGFAAGPSRAGLAFVSYLFRIDADRAAAAGMGASPHVISTSPADRARISAGPFILSVTFDRPMTPDSYSFTTPEGPDAYPNCPGKPTRSRDGRTFSMACVALAARSYAVGFNGGRFRNFTDTVTHVPAETAVLHFTVR